MPKGDLEREYQNSEVFLMCFILQDTSYDVFSTASLQTCSLQQAMAGMDLRGKETDVIMWDSSMTEKSHSYFTFFMKQALISGNRAPFMIGSGYEMREFNRVASADIGEHGEGWNGPVTESEKQALTIPWAAR